MPSNTFVYVALLPSTDGFTAFAPSGLKVTNRTPSLNVNPSVDRSPKLTRQSFDLFDASAYLCMNPGGSNSSASLLIRCSGRDCGRGNAVKLDDAPRLSR